MSEAELLEKTRYAVVVLIALIFSITFHEFGHAVVADKLGDRLPRTQGRVTLNPMAHADPFGTLLFPLIGLLAMGGVLFGWGRPVQVNPPSFTRQVRMKTGHLLVALAGPTMNLVLAGLVSVIYVVLLRAGGLQSEHPRAEIEMLIGLNFFLAGLNLIPCPPLDGAAILAGVLPDRDGGILEFLERWGFMILLGLLITGALDVLLRPVGALAGWWLTAIRAFALA